MLADKTNGSRYLRILLEEHISGQMKIAPEHTENDLLVLMGKPGKETLTAFKVLFDETVSRLGNRCFLTYYFIAAHPGCTLAHMKALHSYIRQKLKIIPRQVQIFTPTPSTYSSLMYYTGTDPFTGKALFVERDNNKKQEQKNILSGNP